MLPTCLRTAASLTTSRCAIEPLVNPSAIRPSTSCSRAVSRAIGASLVLPAPDVTLDELSDEVRDAVGSASVETTDSWLHAQSDDFRRSNNRALIVMLGPAGAYAGIAIVNTLLVASLRRRREFVAARLLGATPRQIRRMILWESSLVSLAALTIGGGITAAVAVLARRAMMADVQAVTTTIPWLTLAAIVAACVTLAVAAALVPANRVLRDAQPAAATAAD